MCKSHAQIAAEKVFPKPLVSSDTWWHMTITAEHRQDAVGFIQEAIDADCALLRQQNGVLLEAMAALRKRCDRYEREPRALNQFLLDDGWTQAEIDDAVKKIRETRTRS